MNKEEIKEVLTEVFNDLEHIQYGHDEDSNNLAKETSKKVEIIIKSLTNKESEEQPKQSVEEFIKMILNSYKVINEVDDYRKIHISIVQQAEILNNKLIDFKTEYAQQNKGNVSDEDIQKEVDDIPYYGHCTTEYKEGFEDGAKWMREQLNK